MSSNYSLDELKNYHNEAMNFFTAQVFMVKEVIPFIKNERISQTAVLLFGCNQTGSAILKLNKNVENFSSEIVMLARAFIERITNFCYASICDEKEFRAFILHPVYKHYHNFDAPKIDEDPFSYIKNYETIRKEKEELKQNPIVQEALSIFSETKHNMNWTRKTIAQRIKALEDWGQMLDFFFSLSKIQYYSDSSEALHGSLYGSIYSLGLFDSKFNHKNEIEFYKKKYKDSACVLLHLGILIHETFTLIHYSNEIEEIYENSYKNRTKAINLLFHIIEHPKLKKM